MLINRSYSIRHENGLIIIPDFECVIEASLDWEYGEPVATIDDLLVTSWDGKQRISLMYDIDPAFTGLVHRLIEMIEDDESILDDLVDDYGDPRAAAITAKAEAERDMRAVR